MASPHRSKCQCEYCQFQGVLISIVHSRTEKITTSRSMDQLNSLWFRLHLSHEHHKAPSLTHGSQWGFVSSEITVDLEPVSSYSWKVWECPFPQCIPTLLNGQGYLGSLVRFTVCSCSNGAGLSSRRLSIPSNQEALGLWTELDLATGWEAMIHHLFNGSNRFLTAKLSRFPTI